MELSLFGIKIVVYRAQYESLNKRRQRAKLVLQKCNYSSNVIDRIKAVRSLGLSVFPELRYHNDDTNTDLVGLKLAKEWVESAFLDDGKGDIA